MKNFFVGLIASIISFFTGTPEAAITEALPTIGPTPSIEASSSPSIKPYSKQSIKPRPSSTPAPTSTPAPSAPAATATPTPAPTSTPAPTFTPIIKSGTFRLGAGNCNQTASGTYTLEIVNYNQIINITDLKVKVSLKGLNPATHYVLNIGSTGPLGGPSIYANASGDLEYSNNNFGYTVKYDQIYSISIDDFDKLYPNNSCLLDDLGTGRG
ncbi:MAG: hypothetical protein WAV40_05060 [Microgenomates group bacterium]